MSATLSGNVKSYHASVDGLVDNTGSVVGEMSSHCDISGYVSQPGSIDGNVTSEVAVTGSVQNDNFLQGVVALAKEFGVSPEMIQKAIEDFFRENPVDVITNYPDLRSKPQINGVTLEGNKTHTDLNLQPAGNYLTEVPPEYVTNEDLDRKGFATKEDIPVDYLTEDDLARKDYAAKSDIPQVPSWSMQQTKPVYTPFEVGADPEGTSMSKISEHNVDIAAHNDIRVVLSELTNRINALADSDDTTLDQMSEIVKYIKSNKSLIDAITTGKISYSDIIDNLVTNLPDRPLSAAQGVVLKSLIDAIKVPTKVSQLENDQGYLTEHQDISGKLDADKLQEAVDEALAQAKDSGEFDGQDGYTPVKNVDYFDGERGPQGVQGIQGIQGPRGERGEPFFVSKVYPSVNAMHLAYSTDEVPDGGFVVIDTGNVDDEDNAKLFYKGSSQYEYLTDLSGAQGIQGPPGEQGIQGIQGIQGVPGEPGAVGKAGKDGYTPQRGKDYWTDADKAEIVQQTAQQIKVPTKTSELTNDSGFLTKHQDVSLHTKTIVADTHIRNFTTTQLSQYCACGHIEHWSSVSNKNDYKTGDICLIKAYNTSANNQKVYIIVLVLYATSNGGVQGMSLGYAPVEWS